MNKNDIQLGRNEVGRMPPHSLGEREAMRVPGGWVLLAHVCMQGRGCTSHSHLHARMWVHLPLAFACKGVGAPPTRICMQGCGCTSHSHLHARKGGGGPVLLPAHNGSGGGGVGGANEATSPPCIREKGGGGWWFAVCMRASEVVGC